MSISQRLKKYLEHKGISEGKFETTAKLSNGFVSKERKSLYSDSIDKIKESAPDLNIEWLLKGIGEMIMDVKVSEPASQYVDQLIAELRDRLKEKDVRLAEKDRWLADKEIAISEIRESKELWKEKALGYEKKISADVGELATKKQARPHVGRAGE